MVLNKLLFLKKRIKKIISFLPFQNHKNKPYRFTHIHNQNNNKKISKIGKIHKALFNQNQLQLLLAKLN